MGDIINLNEEIVPRNEFETLLFELVASFQEEGYSPTGCAIVTVDGSDEGSKLFCIMPESKSSRAAIATHMLNLSEYARSTVSEEGS